MRLKYFTAAVCAIGLQACAVNPSSTIAEGASSGTVPGVAATATSTPRVKASSGLSKLEEGDAVVFNTGTLAKFGKVTIGRQYTAASGKICKQVYDFSGVEMIGIACRSNKDLWYTRLSS